MVCTACGRADAHASATLAVAHNYAALESSTLENSSHARAKDTKMTSSDALLRRSSFEQAHAKPTSSTALLCANCAADRAEPCDGAACLADTAPKSQATFDSCRDCHSIRPDVQQLTSTLSRAPVASSMKLFFYAMTAQDQAMFAKLCDANDLHLEAVSQTTSSIAGSS